jgi:hypothetical protein
MYSGAGYFTSMAILILMLSPEVFFIIKKINTFLSVGSAISLSVQKSMKCLLSEKRCQY